MERRVIGIRTCARIGRVLHMMDGFMHCLKPLALWLRQCLIAQAIIDCSHKTKLETVAVCGGYFESLRKIKLLEPSIAAAPYPRMITVGCCSNTRSFNCW